MLQHCLKWWEECREKGFPIKQKPFQSVLMIFFFPKDFFFFATALAYCVNLSIYITPQEVYHLLNPTQVHAEETGNSSRPSQ